MALGTELFDFLDWIGAHAYADGLGVKCELVRKAVVAGIGSFGGS